MMTGLNEPMDPSEKLHTDMRVIGRDGNHIGTISKVRPHDFLLHRPLSPAVFVPFSAIDMISEKDNRVVLTVTEGEIAEADWPGLESEVSAFKPLGGK